MGKVQINVLYQTKVLEFQHILGILQDFSKCFDVYPQSRAVRKFLKIFRFLDIAWKLATGEQNTQVVRNKILLVLMYNTCS